MNKLLKLNSRKSLAVLLGVISMAALSMNPAIAKPGKYGLGLPANSGTAGAIRSSIPPVVVLAPEDGGRTVSENPTFYWYLSSNSPYKTIFQIKDGTSGETVLKVDGESIKKGLYKFTLPATTLKSGKVYTWQLSFNKKGSSSGFSTINQVLLVNAEPEMRKAMSAANTELEKAKVYSNYGYWYDALDSYNKWLEFKPSDTAALQERNSIVSEVLTSLATEDKQKAEANVAVFVKQLTPNPIAQSFKPKS